MRAVSNDRNDGHVNGQFFTIRLANDTVDRFAMSCEYCNVSLP